MLYNELMRIDKFNNLGFWQKKLLKKLKKDEIEFCKKFLISNENLSNNDFAFKVNRLFIDEKNPPKNRHIMVEIIGACI